MRATYSPEDNKLRVYPDGERVDSVLSDQEYEKFKSAGYRWAAKQECFVCPRWTPSAENWALDLAGEIDDEDYSAAERSADRAERYGDYRDKRANEAGAAADAFAAGPSSYGAQSAARAERLAARHDRHRGNAVNCWDKAEYWQERTRGVIRHALHRAKPEVRRSRIKRLEAEQRKHEKERASAVRAFRAWQSIPTLAGADEAGNRDSGAWKIAYICANTHSHGFDYEHPRTGRKSSLYSHLTDATDPITPAESASLYLAGRSDPADDASRWARWSRHYELRLEYERAMLANEGGAATDVEIEPGGWVGKFQVQQVNRSAATGKVVSVKLWGEHDYKKDSDGNPLRCLKTVSLERFSASIYRPPTDEERQQFAADKKAAKAARGVVPTVNLSPEDAARLQAIFNAAAEAHYRALPSYRKNSGGSTRAAAVEETTQAKFSSDLKYEYVAICELSDGSNRVKVRVKRAPMYAWHRASAVVRLTDKPSKPLGLNWEALEAALVGAAESRATSDAT